MRAWSSPDMPVLPVLAPPVSLHDTSRGRLVATAAQGPAGLYVCGITPYDATHIGHAATYVAFDLLCRAWRGAGRPVTYVQNVTDVDDPLLERARRDGEQWEALAQREIDLFREDMAALRVLPPDHYVGVVESIDLVVAAVQELLDSGAAYRVDDDVYFDIRADAGFGAVSGMAREEMLAVFPERGGDPDRPGKRDRLDALLWRAERPGEPAWPSPFGPGRPGWHIECSAIAVDRLGMGFEVQGGGSDLVFPHHEMSASHAEVAERSDSFAQIYAHAGMVGFEGEKMSKSRGNLVFVSTLRRDGVDPMAIRLALLTHHYRSDWEWTPETLTRAEAMLDWWRRAVGGRVGAPARPIIEAALAELAVDVNAPAAVELVQAWADSTMAGAGGDPSAGLMICDFLDAALGIRL